ncbi:MAG: hypothetical protein MJ232_07555 [archaeon]|nr:hypothetical protein [archaeon]
MTLKFSNKIFPVLLMLCVACLCIGAVSAADVNGHSESNNYSYDDGGAVWGADNDSFIVHGDSVYCSPYCSANSAGFHWEITCCDGFKLISDEKVSCSHGLIGGGYFEKFHFQRLFANRHHIVLTEFDHSGYVIATLEYNG